MTSVVVRPCPYCGQPPEHLHIFRGEEIVRCARIEGRGCREMEVWGATFLEAIQRWNDQATRGHRHD